MKKIALPGIILTTLALVSCGGSTTIPSNIVIGGSLQNYMTTPTYQSGTEELAAFYAINSFRNSVGLGYWNQSIYLDNAAANHIKYSQNNTVASPSFQTDIEVAGNPYFTGTTPSQRAIYTGYYFIENTPTALNVSTAYVGELYSTGSGANIVNAMVNTIYHRSALMAQATVQVGLARDIQGPITSLSPTVHWWISHGRLTSSQSVASNYIGVYPYDQETNVPLYMDSETPSVYSNVANFNFNTETSSPVSFTTSSLVQLTTTSFTVTQIGSTTPLPGNIWTMHNDPNLNTSDYSQATINLTTPPTPVPTLAANEVYWVGKQPFLPNTTYIATYTGTSYLIPYALTNPISKTWTFTTGSGV